MKKILCLVVSITAFLLTSCITGAALVGKSSGVTQEVWLYRNEEPFSKWADIKWTIGTSYSDLFGGGSIKVLAPLPSEMVSIQFSSGRFSSASLTRSNPEQFPDKEGWKSFEWKFPQLVGKEKWVKGYESQLEKSPDIQKKFSELKDKYKDISKYDYVVEVQFDASDIEFKKNEYSDSSSFYNEIWYEAYIPEGKVKDIKVYEWSLPNEVPVILNGKEVGKRKISNNNTFAASFECTKMKDVIDGFKFNGYTGRAVLVLPLQVTCVGDHYSCEGYEFWCGSESLVQGGKIQTKVTYDYASVFSTNRSWLKTFFCFEFDEKSGTFRLELHRGDDIFY